MKNEHTLIQAAVATNCNEFSQEPLSVGTRIEGLEIREVIGVGGFGIVYKAWDPMLERLVALKEYLPTTLAVRMPSGTVRVRDARHNSTYEAGLRSFVNEARLLAQFDHAALVKVYRFWEMAGTAYMVMPLYQGMTLKQYVEQHPEPLPEQLLLNWLMALTEALETMHAQRCYHRDISPENIIIQEGSGLPILLDFGAARRAIGSVSQPFTVILKASYAPIEQYAEVPSMTQGPWTDVYALAAVAHFLITGKTPPSSVSRLMNDSYVPLHTLPGLPFSAPVKLGIDRALAVQPDDRTPSMAMFRNELFAKPGSPLDLAVDIPTAEVQAIATKKQRHFIPLASIALGALVLITFAWFGAPVEIETEPPPILVEEPTPPIAPPPPPTEVINPAFQAVLNRADSPLSVQMDNTVLKIGEDLLRFQVLSPISGYVAVYVLSSDQSLIQLLPNARVPALSIQANQALTLPPANEPIQAAGPAGINQFLIVVTQEPRNYDHLDLQDHYGFGLIQGEHGQLEGIGSCVSMSCQDKLAAAWFSVEEVD